MIGGIVATVVGFSASMDYGLLYSKAVKDFVGAVLSAIDRGDVDSAHRELRKFSDESIETYEGGALLRWLREPTERLNAIANLEQK